jgi:hypothetical protein
MSGKGRACMCMVASQFLLGPNCRPAPVGCGKTEPGSTFWVKDGVLFGEGARLLVSGEAIP